MKKIELTEKQITEAKNILSAFKTYVAFSHNKDSAYRFTNIIGIKVCPYCNIEYAYTVYDGNGLPVLRPDIDHFVPKNSKTGNSNLQLELTNLIPSCLICNERLKGRKRFSGADYLHPYFDDFDTIMKFHINLNDTDYLTEKHFEICFVPSDDSNETDITRARNSIQVFRLKERYAFHKDAVVMLFKRMKHYNYTKRQEIGSLFGIQPTAEQLAFPEAHCEINKTSLGKLKRDIISEYFRF